MEDLREQIDRIDEGMRNLFLERMQVVKQVAEYKRVQGLPVLDSKREELILEKNISRIDDTELKEFYEAFFKQVIEVSKQYQERILEK